MKKYFISVFTIILFYSCNSDPQSRITDAGIKKDTLHYIFLGHLRSKGFRVDRRVEGLNFNNYDRIWLGGDVLSESSLKFEYLEYIDSLFDVSNPSNQWAFGNHDLRNFNVEWLEKITARKTYSSHFENNITTVVLNLFLGPDDCERLDDQYYMLKNVCDTIQESTHLILLSHQNIWRGIPGLPGPNSYSHYSQFKWVANCFDKSARFLDVIYPLLIEVKNRNINVICVMGDTGLQNKKGISMVSDDGIYFIASGINKSWAANAIPDKVLIFEHIPASGQLNWKFHNLDSLYKFDKKD